MKETSMGSGPNFTPKEAVRMKEAGPHESAGVEHKKEQCGTTLATGGSLLTATMKRRRKDGKKNFRDGKMV
ncbi:hypothetical protein NL676_002181 [Syzygium grande]|nr:hypothetical protein NL676_002181 [Syzygium grande]